MAAPTPVSAYLHSAAMVKAGIYLVARLAPDFNVVTTWHLVVIPLGLMTMLMAGWMALRQKDLKLVLAYGTVSQLGFITATVAIVLPTFFLTLTVVRLIPLRPVGRFGKAVRDGLAPISIGLLAAGGLVLAKSADTGIVQAVLTLATVAAVVMTKWNPVWLIALGAVVGVILQL